MPQLDYLKILPGYDPYRNAAGCTFDAATADKAIQFFETVLTHVKGVLKGKPLLLEPWQQATIGNIFGWKRPDGTRRYRKVLVYVPRKNGKSILAAGICLYCLFCDGEPGAEIYCAAKEREQASQIWDMAQTMIDQQPILREHCKIYKTFRTIELPKSGSKFRPFSADDRSKHGYNASCTVIDELHTQPDSRLIDVLRTSSGARTQPLMVYVTTADFKREGSPCNRERDYACQVRDGVIDDPYYLPIVYEIESGDDWASPEVWEKCNPNLGVSIPMSYLEEEFKEAQARPYYEATFRRLHLNEMTGSSERWLSSESWEACGADFTEEDLRGMPCYGGLDLAATTDIASFSLAFPTETGYKLISRFWCPKEKALDRERRDEASYGEWVRAGYLLTTEGNVIDYGFIRAEINDIAERFEIVEIACDPFNAQHLMTDLSNDGFQVYAFRQGFLSMNEPAKEFERAILSRNLQHNRNPVMTWMVSNCMVETDAAGNIKPSKKRSTEKIDGVVSGIMAVGRAMVGEVSEPPRISFIGG